MNKKFKVDLEKCSKCGLCAKDCLSGAIEIIDDTPKMVYPLKCIKCQHCLAICPSKAISILDKSPLNSEEIKQVNSDEILNLIKSRRSTRNYKKINVSKDTLEKLKTMLNYTPTGCNNHKLHFSFIEDI